MAVSLLLSLALLWAARLASTAEQCFSREYSDLVVNASAALLARSTALDGRASPSQQACLLNCCSQAGFKCNWAIYKPDKVSGNENCYLFHCASEEDCPLIPMKGVNSYNIFAGVDYPTVDHLTSAKTLKEPTSAVTGQLEALATEPGFNTTQLAPTTTTQIKTTTPIITTAQVLAATTTTQVTITTQPTTIITTVTTQPTTTTTTSTTSMTQPTTTTTTQPTTTKSPTTQPTITATTTTPTAITMTQPVTTTTSTIQPTTATTIQSTTNIATATTQHVASTAFTWTPLITTVFDTAAPTETSKHQASTLTQLTRVTKPTIMYMPMQTAATLTALTAPEQPLTATEIVNAFGLNGTKSARDAVSKPEMHTVTAMSTAKPSKKSKNHIKPTRKQAMKPASYNTRLVTTSAATMLPVTHTVQSATTMKEQTTIRSAPKKPKTNLRTTTTTITTDSVPRTTTKLWQETVRKAMTGSPTPTGVSPQTTLKETKTTLAAPPFTPNPIITNPVVKNTGHQGALKSTVEVVVVVALVSLTLVIALMGRKAMESFNRRQYTRLELNDLYYDV